MSSPEDAEKKRGPRGGIKHQPGRGHDDKSGTARKKRFAKRAARKRRDGEEEASKLWDEWDALPEDVKRLLGPAAEPNVPRPPKPE